MDTPTGACTSLKQFGNILGIYIFWANAPQSLDVDRAIRQKINQQPGAYGFHTLADITKENG
jgi:hypothetical protein|eukprot:CAMPEP_0174332486 /NCGR_PEP_ID=MMETSP0810-20121108/18347_1 /TAXON_ID=73025 ORGANISM="Eutreptiella gymnastica-like, Strain CCMP1594" /NCGR_SAMPLE_ID=MMETSP0810 /ASSEMBLY_ACC=CAM_ASM_000659 /LENGTH=61 /DNA_ID=CAMNT_0015448945 /DNA_START=167 /DNA_END=352 /DNA_ORIENTATION=+